MAVAMTPHPHETVQVTSQSPSNDEVLFVGLFYEDGPEAFLLPAVVPDYTKTANLTSPAARARSRKQEHLVVSQIKQADPGFFVAFDKKMRSGDVIQVREALQEAVTKIDAAESQNKLTVSSAADDDSDCGNVNGCVVEVIIDQNPPPMNLARILKNSPLMQDRISSNLAAMLSINKQ